MAIAKKPKLDVKDIDKIIKRGGSISSEKAQEDVVNVSLKLSYKLNSTIEALQKNQFGMKRTKKQRRLLGCESNFNSKDNTTIPPR